MDVREAVSRHRIPLVAITVVMVLIALVIIIRQSTSNDLPLIPGRWIVGSTATSTALTDHLIF